MTHSLVTSAAEQAATQPPDYAPAIIGLLGVVIGGIIQTVAQVFKDRSARVAQTRAEVMEFVHAAFAFVDSLAQYIAIMPSLEDETAIEVGDRLTARQAKAHAAGIALAGAADARVAAYSVTVLNTILDCADGFRPVLNRRSPTAEEERTTYPSIAEARKQINVLLNMVHPRSFEIHHRFRSATGAKKLMAKDEASTRKARENVP